MRNVKFAPSDACFHFKILLAFVDKHKTRCIIIVYGVEKWVLLMRAKKERKKRLKIAVKNVFVCLAIPKIFVRVNKFAGASVEFKRNRKKTLLEGISIKSIICSCFFLTHSLTQPTPISINLFPSLLRLLYATRHFAANVLLLFFCFSISKVCVSPSLSLPLYLTLSSKFK